MIILISIVSSKTVCINLIPFQIMYDILYKISKLEYLEEIKRGSLYMKPISWFRSLEDGGQGDAKEGLYTETARGVLYVRTKARKYSVCELTNMKINAKLKSPIFCFSYAKKQNLNQLSLADFVSQKLIEEFTNKEENYGIIIVKKKMFEHRLALAAKTLVDMSGYVWDKVTYSDAEDLYLNPVYRKRTKFAHQNEFRLLLPKVEKEKDEYYRLELGSLEDFSCVLPISFN